MKIIFPTFITITILLLDTSYINGANILGLFPHPGKSHFDVFQVLMRGLAARGHNVTVVSFFPNTGQPIENYTDISLVGTMPIFVNIVTFDLFELARPWMMPYVNIQQLSSMGLDTCENVLPSQPIQQLITSTDKYDLVITEQFNTNCFLSVVYKLQAKFIALSSCNLLPWGYYPFRNPRNPSYIPNTFYGAPSRMSLSERVHNTFVDFLSWVCFYWMYELPAQRLVHKYIGTDVPPLQELAADTSLILVNSHFTLQQPRPLLPNIVEIGGLHLKPMGKIPPDVLQFIEEADSPVILFSLGSMLKADTLSQERVNVFLNVFKHLKHRVVWKFEGSLPNVPDNVLIRPWLPQQDILCRPKVRAFLAHGGLLGLTEALHCGVPIVGIPMFGDQFNNLRQAETIGLAALLHYKDLSEHQLLQKLNVVLDKSFWLNVQKLSRIFNDRQQSPLETSIYWVEYILRHDGAKHLQSPAKYLTWYQYYLLDVGIILFAIVVIVCFLIYMGMKKLFVIYHRKKTKTD